LGKQESTMENLEINSFWSGMRVLVTGHTGFKGSWLSFWLHQLGAEVFGVALEPETNPSLFGQLHLEKNIHHFIGDIRDEILIRQKIITIQPDIVFHLAAQPLVRRSYREPLLTWQTNVMGTANLLNALVEIKSTCAVVIVTTDKVYENREWIYPYRECDRLGGLDPYSSSKASAEIAVSSWRSSFFSIDSTVRIATARAGNVIGGGDWSEDRIIPDLVRALSNNKPVLVRNPQSVRPWQHVLEPLKGYMRLAQILYESENLQFQSAFNFGPEAKDFRCVQELVENALKVWPGSWVQSTQVQAPHEAGLLSLAIDKVRSVISWQPKWNFEESVLHTLEWYKLYYQGANPQELCLVQLKLYSER